MCVCVCVCCGWKKGVGYDVCQPSSQWRLNARLYGSVHKYYVHTYGPVSIDPVPNFQVIILSSPHLISRDGMANSSVNIIASFYYRHPSDVYYTTTLYYLLIKVMYSTLQHECVGELGAWP